MAPNPRHPSNQIKVNQSKSNRLGPPTDGAGVSSCSGQKQGGPARGAKVGDMEDRRRSVFEEAMPGEESVAGGTVVHGERQVRQLLRSRRCSPTAP